jgi:hypothetical protein
MDFAAVMTYIKTEFSRARIRYALIGGHAVSLYAEPRMTRDMDFIVHREDLAKAESVMLRIGYRVGRRERGFTQFVGAVLTQGVVDLAHASKVFGTAILRKARFFVFPGSPGRVPVVAPEDLIGLKIVAMANNPLREERDDADIVAVARACRTRLNWKRISQYYVLVKRPGGTDKLKKRAMMR